MCPVVTTRFTIIENQWMMVLTTRLLFTGSHNDYYDYYNHLEPLDVTTIVNYSPLPTIINNNEQQWTTTTNQHKNDPHSQLHTSPAPCSGQGLLHHCHLDLEPTPQGSATAMAASLWTKGAMEEARGWIHQLFFEGFLRDITRETLQIFRFQGLSEGFANINMWDSTYIWDISQAI